MIRACYFIILISFYTLSAYAKDSYFQFINNPGFCFNKKLAVSVDYLHNFAYYWMLMYPPLYDYPSYDKEAQFHLYRAYLSSESFYFEYGRFLKPRLWPGEKPCVYDRKTFDKRYWKMMIRVKRTKYCDIGLSYLTYNRMLATLLSKKFKNFYYSIGYQKYILSFGIIGIPNLFSCAYSPVTNLWIFDEIAYHKKDGQSTPGYMNIIGISYRFPFVAISFFYNLICDKSNYGKNWCGFGRYDHRFGVQVKFEPVFSATKN